MPLKLKLDANKIYHKEFEGTKPGYNAFASRLIFRHSHQRL